MPSERGDKGPNFFAIARVFSGHVQMGTAAENCFGEFSPRKTWITACTSATVFDASSICLLSYTCVIKDRPCLQLQKLAEDSRPWIVFIYYENYLTMFSVLMELKLATNS